MFIKFSNLLARERTNRDGHSVSSEEVDSILGSITSYANPTGVDNRPQPPQTTEEEIVGEEQNRSCRSTNTIASSVITLLRRSSAVPATLRTVRTAKPPMSSSSSAYRLLRSRGRLPLYRSLEGRVAPNLVVDGPNVVQGAVHSISRSPSTDDGSCYPTSVKEHY